MKRVVRNLVASGAVVAAAAFGTACGEEQQSAYADNGDRQVVQDAVVEAGKFWASQGLEDGKTLRAEIAVGGTALSCGEYTVTSGSGDMRYCPEDNTIGVSLAAINSLRGNIGEKADIAIKGWVREAVGDFVQHEDSSMLADAPTDEDLDSFDLYPKVQRTCLAGIVTWNVAGKDLPLDKRETPIISASFLRTEDYADVGHWLERGYNYGYEAMTKDRNVCIDLPLPD